jgi:hypothetical protein
MTDTATDTATDTDWIADERAVERLVNDYGHLVDTRRWSELGTVFTDDVVFDAEDFGSPVRTGLARLAADFAALGDGHPICHHASNIVIDRLGADTARVRSKGLCVLSDGSVFACIYLDDAVRTDRGWRLSRRTALLRRPWAQASAAQLDGRLE